MSLRVKYEAGYASVPPNLVEAMCSWIYVKYQRVKSGRLDVLALAKAREAEGGAWLEELVEWLTQAKVLSDAEVRRDLKRWVPEFQAQAKPKLKQVTGTKAA